jgi:hypothetical protein
MITRGRVLFVSRELFLGVRDHRVRKYRARGVVEAGSASQKAMLAPGGGGAGRAGTGVGEERGWLRTECRTVSILRPAAQVGLCRVEGVAQAAQAISKAEA